MERIWKNSFLKGIQNDLDKAISPAESYLESHNVTLTTNQGFLALTNIAGTLEVDTLINSFTGNVLAVYANKYKIGDIEGVECLTVFTSQPSGNFKILAYDLENSQIYEIFQQVYTSEFEASIPVVDLVCYPEGGIDIVYFTDNFNEIRKLRCEIPNPYVTNFYTPEQLSLQRRGTMGKISLDQIITGGSLLSGTYQFVLRLFNEDLKSYTRWTIPSTPVIVSRAVSGEPNQGGYGIGTNKKIQLDITVPTYELDNWTHYQLAVFENTQLVNIVNASLQKPEDLTSGTVVGEYTRFDFDYKENVKVADVAIEDIVVDLAAIQTVKTLQVKNNRLFGGNITYWNREYDNGNPEITGSLIDTAAELDNDTDLSKFRGHFRNEVYRYYISYHDEYFNYSRPKTLDLSAITGNLISNGDFKFPSRKTAGYTLLNFANRPRAIGLSFTVNNHPSWARGFIILRAKRKKRVKFQSPFIPSSLIEGVEVVGGYPNTVIEYSTTDGFSDRSVPGATPMNPVGTLMPKNFLHTVKKDIVRLDTDVTGTTEVQKGECKYSGTAGFQKSSSAYFLYSPTQWGRSYTFEVGDKYEITDYAFLKTKYTSFKSLSGEPNVGNYLKTSVHASLYASNLNDYYYDDSVTRSDPSLPTKTGELLDYKDIDNVGEGTNISNYSVAQYSNLDTQGVFYNTIPNTQRVGVVALKSPRNDDALYGNSSYGGNRLTSSNGGIVKDGLYEINEDQQTNTFAPHKSGYVDGDYVSIVPIVNIVNDFGDDRYGESDTIHEMVFTGAQHIFSESEITQIQIDGQVAISLSVWGGDCFVNLQQTKLTDNHYGLVNAEKQGGGTQLVGTELGTRWIKLFRNKFYHDGEGNVGRKYVAMPVPYENMSQTLSVMVESEELTNILNPYPYNDFQTIGIKRIVSETDDASKLRIPFSYGYNINYSKESDQKAFVPFNEDEQIVTKFKSRGIFSDQKVYQTDIQGFDIFRVSNIFDLEETYGGITKLTLVGDDLFAVQESGVAFIPVDAQELSTTTGDTVSVRSGEVVSVPRYISRLYGSQHLKSVVSKDNLSIFADNNNQAIVKLQGGNFELIHENGIISETNVFLANDISSDSLYGLYDNNRRQYLLVNRTSPFCWVWDDRLGFWVSQYDFSSENCLYDGVYAYNKFYVLGRNAGNLKIFRMYEGDYNQLCGTTVTPKVIFSVNPEFDYAKTFDNINIYSTDKLDTLDIVSARETGETNQEVTGIDIDVNRREGNYRVAILRDSDNARIRGMRANVTLKWRTDNEQVLLSSVVTKYRLSQRSI